MVLKSNNILLLTVIKWYSWTILLFIFCFFIFFITTGNKFTIIRLLSYAYPWLAGLLFISSPLTVITKQRVIGIFMIILAIFVSLPFFDIFFSDKQISIRKGHEIFKVMTYSKMGRNKNIDAVARVVIKESPDILLMQEISAEESKQLINKLKNIYRENLFYFFNEFKGLILSRYPVSSKWKKSDGALFADISLPNQVIKVWNVHLPKAILQTNMQYKNVNALAEIVGKELLPTIVAGDFNATINNYPYIKIKNILRNAFEDRGRGFGFTFPTSARRMGIITAFIRIDHIFYSNHFNVYKAYVVNEAGGSDHYPVVALLSLNK